MADLSEERAATAVALTTRLFDREPPRWVLMVLLCAVLVVRGRVMLAFSTTLDQDPGEFRNIAWRIYNNYTFGLYQSQFGMLTSTASRPPLYPLALAAFRCSQLRMGAESIGLLNVVWGACTVWGVWRLARLWGLSVGASLLASALVGVDPLLLMQTVQATPETLATLLGVLSLIALTLAAREEANREIPAAESSVSSG